MLRMKGTESPSRPRQYQWYDGPRGVGHIKNYCKIEYWIECLYIPHVWWALNNFISILWYNRRASSFYVIAVHLQSTLYYTNHCISWDYKYKYLSETPPVDLLKPEPNRANAPAGQTRLGSGSGESNPWTVICKLKTIVRGQWSAHNVGLLGWCQKLKNYVKRVLPLKTQAQW